MEFSVLVTQLTDNSYGSLGNLIAMRVVHTFGMLILAALVSQTLIGLKKTELNYLTIALICTVVIALGDIMHGYLAGIFDVELISIYRRVGIIVLQGTLWFPALIIVVGIRREIIESFKQYEQRLIVATRLRSRSSDEFKQLQSQIQDRIRIELYGICGALKNAILKSSTSGTLSERNLALRPLLVGEELRRFSRGLQSFEAKSSKRRFLKVDPQSIVLLLQQFRILHSLTIRRAPLSSSPYILVLIALVAPPYINFYSIKEAVISFPILTLLIFIFAQIITKSQSGITSRFSSLLIFLTGLLPFVVNGVGQMINHDPATSFPLVLTALALPLTYYVFMEVMQVLRPKALTLIQSDELTASSALQDSVTKTVSDEFSQNLSHQWAVFIHGKILTRLAATSLKLESAATAGDQKAFDSTLESLISLLNAPDDEFEEASNDLETELGSRLRPWIGLLEINLSVDSELKSLRNTRVRDLGEVIEELISNSIRHGKAKKIDLKIVHSSESDIQIIAVDDATVAPPSFDHRLGLGTSIFNLASDGRWSIRRVGSSTEFKLTMGIVG